MGGNALKGQVKTVRVSAVDGNKHGVFAMQILRCLSGHTLKTYMVKSYYSKETMGDVDIVVESGLFAEYDAAQIIEAFKDFYATPFIPFKKNGPVLSLGVPLDELCTEFLQIDLISTPIDHFDFACRYYNWNDCGNLIGRVARKMGLKFGHDGLSLPVRNGTQLLATINLTTDFDQALYFLGFDFERHMKGFIDLEDIFQWVADSFHFNPSIYPLEARNHTARVRDKKRPTYMAFLRWCDEHKDEFEGCYEFGDNKEEYIRSALQWFDKEKEYDQILRHAELSQRTRKKVLGCIRELTDIDGSDLGMFLGYLRKEHPFREEDLEVLDSLSENEVSQKIANFLQDYEKNA